MLHRSRLLVCLGLLIAPIPVSTFEAPEEESPQQRLDELAELVGKLEALRLYYLQTTDAKMAAEKAAGNEVEAAKLQKLRDEFRISDGNRKGDFYNSLVGTKWQLRTGLMILNADGTVRWKIGSPMTEWTVHGDSSILIRWPTGSWSVADFAADRQTVTVHRLIRWGGLTGDGSRMVE